LAQERPCDRDGNFSLAAEAIAKAEMPSLRLGGGVVLSHQFRDPRLDNYPVLLNEFSDHFGIFVDVVREVKMLWQIDSSH
jgi:hypothetical protein